MKLVKTKDKKLDALLGGGLIAGDSLLVLGSEGTRPEVFGYKFLWDVLQKGGNVGYIFSDLPPALIIEDMHKLNFGITTYLNNEKMRLIDLYSYGLLHREVEPSSYMYRDKTPIPIKHYASIRDLNEVHNVLSEVVKKWKQQSNRVLNPTTIEGCWVYHSISTILQYAQDKQSALRFVGHQMAAQRKHDYIGVFLVHPRMHESTVVEALKYYADVILELEAVEERGELSRTLRVLEAKFRNFQPGKVEYDIKEGEGLTIK